MTIRGEWDDGLTLTIRHTAETLDVSVATIWRCIKAGDLQTVKIRGRTLVLRSSIDALTADPARQTRKKLLLLGAPLAT